MNARLEELSKNLKAIQAKVSAAAISAGRAESDITLVVVTKTFPVEDIHMLYSLGVRNFGENRDQEGSVKAPQLPSDAIWHFQGQIQSNKLKSISTWANVIHSLDDRKHAQKLSEIGTNARVFIQVALEDKLREDRGGVDPDLLPEFLEEVIGRMKLNAVGLMAVAPLHQAALPAFQRLEAISQEVRRKWPQLANISAGMSGDFEAAISAGATHVRVGSSILGSR